MSTLTPPSPTAPPPLCADARAALCGLRAGEAWARTHIEGCLQCPRLIVALVASIAFDAAYDNTNPHLISMALPLALDVLSGQRP